MRRWFLFPRASTAVRKLYTLTYTYIHYVKNKCNIYTLSGSCKLDANFYFPRKCEADGEVKDKSVPLFIVCSGFTGLNSIHPSRYSRYVNGHHAMFAHKPYMYDHHIHYSYVLCKCMNIYVSMKDSSHGWDTHALDSTTEVLRHLRVTLFADCDTSST